MKKFVIATIISTACTLFTANSVAVTAEEGTVMTNATRIEIQAESQENQIENQIVIFDDAEEVEVINESYEKTDLFDDDDIVTPQQNAYNAASRVKTPDAAYEISEIKIDETGKTVIITTTGERVLVNADTDNIVVYAGENVSVYDTNDCIIA